MKGTDLIGIRARFQFGRLDLYVTSPPEAIGAVGILRGGRGNGRGNRGAIDHGSVRALMDLGHGFTCHHCSWEFLPEEQGPVMLLDHMNEHV